MTLTPPAVVDRDAWTRARMDHLAAEKEFTRARDALSAARRELPWLEITADYTFEGPDGPVTLAGLFGDQPQLLLYHFMMGPEWEEGCPSCSFWADGYDGTDVHLAHRDTAFAVVSRAPLARIEEYRTRMGWDFTWVSSHGSDFNYDFAVSFDDASMAAEAPNYNYDTIKFGADEAPGISVFARTGDGRVYLTYQTFARGLDMLNATYHHLDLTPLGRNETEGNMAWLRRHDQY